MSSSRLIPVVFDVLGTCFSFDAATVALTAALGAELAAAGASTSAIVDDWFHSSQRDFTYMSMNGKYQPIGQVLKTSLPRVLLMAGVRPPGNAATFSAPTLAPVFATIPRMNARSSLAACSTAFHKSGAFRLMAATNGGAESTRGLFDLALGKEESSKWAVFSCDEIAVAKPAPIVYEAIWKKLGLVEGERNGWFIASHTWDLFAAKKAGFKTAWVSYEEYIPCEEMWGTPDIIAKDLEVAAQEIVRREASA
ncbi:hypothetical protein RQP46_002857 [Phenoliferia psychrophenolica]